MKNIVPDNPACEFWYNRSMMNSTGNVFSALEIAGEVLEIEARAVEGLKSRLDQNFVRSVELILACSGRVVVSGMGKSGHVARKIASTLASTGTPAFFVHPGEASHGDLGMITKEDVFVALSNSGESSELLTIVPLVKRQGAKLVSMTGNPASSLAREADFHLDAGVDKEACPLDLAPTASTTAALALGDALAVTLMVARGFSAEDFARSHPGGSLGIRLLTHVHDVMRKGAEIPCVAEDAKLSDALLEMSRKGMGMTAIVDRDNQVVGIYTDGDLRRTLESGADFHKTPVSLIMTKHPRTISPARLAAEAVQVMEQYRISQLLVVDEHSKMVGALNMHDLLRAKVI